MEMPRLKASDLRLVSAWVRKTCLKGARVKLEPNAMQCKRVVAGAASLYKQSLSGTVRAAKCADC